jgi:hypothetical protein
MVRVLDRLAGGLIVTCLFVGAAATAQGQEACSAQMLNGAFGFHINGTNVALNVGFAMVGRFDANGNGEFSGSATESSGGDVGKISLSGTYSVEADCSGSAVLTFENGATAHLDFVLTDSGNEALIIDSDSGTIESGGAKRIVSTKFR